MAIRLVIFDLDGTLLNTIEDLAAACNHVLEANGYHTYGLADYKIFVGGGVRRLVERALPEGTPAGEVERMRLEFVDYYGRNIDNGTVPFEGIPQLLHDLSIAGVKMAVASNKFHEGTCKLVREYVPDTDFLRVFGQRPGVPLKPDTAVVDEILEAAGPDFSRETTAFVGDSGVDMDTANAAGIVSVGVTWGFRSRDELEEHGAMHIVDNARQLECLLLEVK